VIEGKPAGGRRGSKFDLVLDGGRAASATSAPPALEVVAPEEGADLGVVPK
jgi:hypothetical protein